MIASSLPLLVAVPLLLAGVTVVWRQRLFDRVLLMLTPTFTLAFGAVLLAFHADTPAAATSLGAFAPGFAIAFASDTLTAIMLTVTGFLTLVAVSYLMISGEDRYRFVTPLVLLLIGGVNGALLTGDLFNLFVFVEVMLLPSYALIAVTGTWRRLGIGRLFVLVNLLTSTFLLMGVGLVYGAAGTVNLARLAGSGEDPSTGLAMGVVVFALLVKAGVVPVHGWLPRSYPATSAGVMGLFSGLHTKVGLYAVYRIVSTVWGADAPWATIGLAVVVLTVLVGSIATFGERRIRGALAYQMVAGVGHILIGLLVFTQLSVAAGLLYMVHHMVTMGSLVFASGAIESTYGSGRFDRLSGLLKREPGIAAVMALGFLSLVGLPPTSGLWGKALLVAGAAEAPRTTAIALIASVVAASFVSLMALQRVWGSVFWGPPMKEFLPDDPETARGERTLLPEDTKISALKALPATLLIAVSLAMFGAITWIWPFFDRAAAGLVDVSHYVKAVLG